MLSLKVLLGQVIATVKVMSGHKHGVEDGRLGVGATNRKRGFAAIIGAAKSRLDEWFSPRISDLQADAGFIQQRIDKVEGLIARCGEPFYSLIATIFRGGLGVFFLLAETGAISGAMAVFGVSDLWRWILAFAFMATTTAYLELVRGHWHQGQRVLAVALVPIAAVGTAALIMFRLVYLKVVEVGIYPGLRRMLVDEGGMYLAVALGTAAIMFAAFSSASWGGVGQSLTHYGLCFRRHRLEAKLARSEKKLRRLQVSYAARLKQLDNIEEAANAEHSRGVEVGQLQPAKWETFEPIPAALTVTSVGAGALLAALGLGLVLWPRLGFAGVVVALLVGIIGFCVMMLRVLPSIKKERQPVQLKLAFPIAGLMVIAVALLSSGCGVTTKHREAPPAYVFSGHGVALVDVSRSVPVSDAELLLAVETIVKHLPLCSKLTVAPIGGSRGQATSLDLPCAVEAFGDNVVQQYSGFRTNLRAALPEWRKHGGHSDYISAMTLAAEMLDGTPHGALVVLGDLVQDVGDKPTTPVIPNLGDLRLSGAKVYLGLLESVELAKLSPQKQTELLSGWKARIEEAGAVGVLPRQFGLHGLDDWCKKTLGQPTETYATFAISSAGGGK